MTSAQLKDECERKTKAFRTEAVKEQIQHLMRVREEFWRSADRHKSMRVKQEEHQQQLHEQEEEASKEQGDLKGEHETWKELYPAGSSSSSALEPQEAAAVQLWS